MAFAYPTFAGGGIVANAFAAATSAFITVVAIAIAFCIPNSILASV